MRLFLAWLAVSLPVSIFSNAQSQSFADAIAGIPSLSNFTALIQAYPSTYAALSNVTVLAPNNDAFSEFLNSSTGAAIGTDSGLLTAILDYHILNGTYTDFTNINFIPTHLQPGSYAKVSGGQRVEATAGDNPLFVSGLLQQTSIVNSTNFDGGVIHVVDRLLTVPQTASATGIAFNLTAAVGAFSAINLTNIVESTSGDVTLFVPNNMAFQAVGSILANLSTADLTSIMEYHVIPSQVLYTTDLENGSSLQSLQGLDARISVKDSTIGVNNAAIVIPNVLIENGVMHVIDQVLDYENPSAALGSIAFPGATSVSTIPFTSGVATPTSSIATILNTSARSSGTAAAATPSGGAGGSGSKSTTHTGAIVGGVIGGLAVVALAVFLFWFIRRRKSGSKPSNDTTTGSSTSHDDAAAKGIGRNDTTRSYHKPELEATTKPFSYQKPELEAGVVGAMARNRADPKIAEVDALATRQRTELNDSSAAQGTAGTARPVATQREPTAQEEDRRRRQEREEEEARLAEISYQRRRAEVEYQKRMAELEHEQRMAELDITASRLRSRDRTLSELEARANPGPGSGD